MKVLIFGASGMVGQGALRECLLADDVHEVLLINRARVPQTHAKLKQIISADVSALSDHAHTLSDVDACFFCLGVSSSGLNERAYTQLTQTLTLAVASQLAALSPAMTFIYISGAGTDSSERGRSMWARVKGRTENELQKVGFARVCLFRPGVIQPLDGIESKTRSYRLTYRVLRPLLTVARRLWPGRIVTTRSVGRAMLNAVRSGMSGIVEAQGIARMGVG